MKKTVFLLLALISVSVVFGQGEKKKVAVYVTGTEEGISEFLGAYLVNSIVSSSDYVAVERTSDFMRELNKEQEYQRTGAVNDDQISQLGRQFGVQLVCVAKIGRVGTQQFVSARLIDVETATVTKSTKPIIFSINDIDKSCTLVTADLFKGENRPVSAGKMDRQETSAAVYQSIHSGSTLVCSGSKVYQNGQQLSADEVRDRLANSMDLILYNKGLKLKRTGNALLWTGAALAAVGCVEWGFLNGSYYDFHIISGFTLTGVSSTMMIIGGGLNGAGKGKIRKSIRQYNNRMSSQSSLQIGATGNGLGFVYNF